MRLHVPQLLPTQLREARQSSFQIAVQPAQQVRVLAVVRGGSACGVLERHESVDRAACAPGGKVGLVGPESGTEVDPGEDVVERPVGGLRGRDCSADAGRSIAEYWPG